MCVSREGYYMFKSTSFRPFISLTACAVLMTGCAIAPGYTDAEKDIKQSLSSSNFQPASREMRENIETQELFAQAAFWSREYELNPGDLESSIKLAAAVRKLGNPQRAIEIAQTTRALYPRDPYLTAEYAAALIASEQAHEAMKPLDQALRSAPGYARLWSLKGAALDQQENYDLARKHYAQAMKITPNDPNIMANVGLSFALSGDPQTAEGWLRRAASVPGASKSVRQNLALVLQLQGKEAEAAKYSDQPNLRGTTVVGKPSSQYVPSQTAQQTARQAREPFSTSQTPNTRSYPQPSHQSGIPASERGSGYKQSYSQPQATHYSTGQFPQTTLQGGSTGAGAPSARKSTPLTASDAARLAAQKSSRRKITLPAGQGAPNHTAAQTSVLDQIAQTIGPQASGPVQQKSLQANSQAGYPIPSPYRARQQVFQNNAQSPQAQSGYPSRRGSARARR